jgi:hypothetical protein
LCHGHADMPLAEPLYRAPAEVGTHSWFIGRPAVEHPFFGEPEGRLLQSFRPLLWMSL